MPVSFGQVHSSHRYLWSPHRPQRNFCCSWRTACQATRSLKANRRKTLTVMMRMQKKRRLQESDNQNTKWLAVWHARLNNCMMTDYMTACKVERESWGGGGVRGGRRLRSWEKCSNCVQLGFQGYEMWAARELLGVWLLCGKSMEKMIWVTKTMLPTQFEIWSSLMTWLRVKPDELAEGHQAWWLGWGLSSLMTWVKLGDLAVVHTWWPG